MGHAHHATKHESHSHEDWLNADQALRDTESRYRSVYECANDAIFVLIDGRYAECNAAAARMFHCDREYLLGRRPEEVSPEVQPGGQRSVDLASAFINRALEGTNHSFEWVHRRRDNSDFHVEVTLSRFSWRGQVHVMATVRDVTAQRLAANALAASEEKYRNIFENAVMGIYQSTPEGTYKSVNPAMATLFGYTSPAEMIHDITDIARDVYVHPEERERLKKSYSEFGYARDFQAELKRKDGTRFWIAIHGKAVRDEHGAITLYEGTIEDITARKRVELELAQHRDRLEDLVSKRTGELEVARVRAEAADRIKSSFLATMSHELRTPLNSILGFTGILLQELPGSLTDEQKKQLGIIRNSARHLLNLINDVLDISKIEAGQLQVASEPLDLRAIIAAAVASVTAQMEEKGLAVACEISLDGEQVMGDRRRVEQVLLNLLANALKFTDHGEVRVTARGVGASVEVGISDTGIGIAEAHLAELFQPFRQVSSGLDRRYHGTGLGLSICKRLVGLMGGQIGVHSEVGVGSRFWFSLPVVGRGET